jgi:hypothetical protein
MAVGTRTGLWRAFLVLFGALMFAGGPMHPGGSMAEMLANPAWVPSHALQVGAFVALTVALILFSRQIPPTAATRRWVRLAALASTLQTVEMVFHTAAVVDHGNLVAGRATPVLTTHLWLTAILYPIFGLAIAVLIATAARERTLGSPWIAWIGILGALAHGAAGLLVAGFDMLEARWLFPLVTLLALWAIAAALWPSKPRTEY